MAAQGVGDASPARRETAAATLEHLVRCSSVASLWQLQVNKARQSEAPPRPTDPMTAAIRPGMLNANEAQTKRRPGEEQEEEEEEAEKEAEEEEAEEEGSSKLLLSSSALGGL